MIKRALLAVFFGGYLVAALALSPSQNSTIMLSNKHHNIPVNISLPTISGTAKVGQTLTGTNGTWTNAPTSYRYMWTWENCGIDNTRTAISAVPVTADIGHQLCFSVWASNSSGESVRVEAALTAVVTSVPTNVSLPTTSGTAQVGQTLAGTNGTWNNNPTSFRYMWTWEDCGIDNTRTTISTVPITADIGHQLCFSVWASNASGESVRVEAALTAVVTAAAAIPTNASLPTISGTAQVGQTLTGTNGTWNNNPTSFRYMWTWENCGIDNTRTTISTVPVTADIGHQLCFSVWASNASGESARVAAALTAVVTAASSGTFDPNNPAASGYSEVFLDDFPGTALNPANWCPNYPSGGSCAGPSNTTNANQISSCDPTHVSVSNGAAHLLLTNNANGGYPTDGACMNSDGPENAGGTPLHSFQPPAGSTGAIWFESTVTLPNDGSNIVKNEPSFWLNGVTTGNRICVPGWPNCGEIDIAEFYTAAPNTGDCTSYHHDVNDWQWTLSAVGATQARTTCTPGNYTGTHKYGALWTNSKISFYVDGNVLFTTTNIVASSPMYLIFFNIADSRTASHYPTTMDVTHVNVWSHP